ncbi:MAG: type II/IV secretion system protein [Candidatus Moraniibacteriota bacterium]|nr:MAG: type II/IV secretion system protein [Candidatus Moranbacteria bacterium]
MTQEEKTIPQSGTSGVASVPTDVAPAEVDLKARAMSLGVPLLEELPSSIDKSVLTLIPEETAAKYKMAAFEKKDGILLVAMVNPQDFEALNVLRFLAEKERLGIEVYLTPEVFFAQLMKRYTGTDQALEEAIQSLKKDQSIDIEKSETTAVTTSEVFQDAPIAKLVDVIVKHALDGRASDIHIEPIEGSYRVRFRVDGILRATLLFPLDVGKAVISRIKILSNLKIDEKQKPQDGRFRVEAAEKSVDLRVSTLPVIDGEKVVMRILDKSNNMADLDKLGLWGRNREVLTRKIREPYGIILITGPTGSGKSTTLYAFLSILNQEERNIITLEDPVEYFMDGINQSQIRPEIGYSFASGLRSILRQDPNVIMVGEIRDEETGELAIHAALTGHLVLSTLHTNDVLKALPRLLDMGAEPFLLAASIQALAAQRLVRRICENCKEPVVLSPAMLKRLEEARRHIDDTEMRDYELDSIGRIVAFQGKGCKQCNNSGYKGRIAIYEVFEITEDAKVVVTDKAGNENELRQEAIKQKMLSMKQDGFLKVLKGITTIAEVERVTEGSLVDEE